MIFRPRIVDYKVWENLLYWALKAGQKIEKFGKDSNMTKRANLKLNPVTIYKNILFEILSDKIRFHIL